MPIDWKFIAKLEGTAITKGYVPRPDTSNSGVTIATGVDLGQTSADQLAKLNISAELVEKLKPYCGLRKTDAVTFLQAHPLILSPEEVEELNGAYEGKYAYEVGKRYSATGAAFDSLPSAAQTVIVSVAYQYGWGLATRCPKFWGIVVRQDWPAAVAELRNFGDKYSVRRNQEADYLEKGLRG